MSLTNLLARLLDIKPTFDSILDQEILHEARIALLPAKRTRVERAVAATRIAVTVRPRVADETG